MKELEEAIDRVVTFGIQSNYDPGVMRRVVEELSRVFGTPAEREERMKQWVTLYERDRRVND